jgi:tRNA G10  N-methylase Trm11
MSFQPQSYAFVLGREKQLCLLELKAVLARFCFSFDVISVYDNLAIIKVENSSDDEIARLIDILGGTIKIFKILNTEFRIQELKKMFCEQIFQLESDGKIDYGISSYSRKYNQNFVNKLGLSIKKELKKEVSLRFVALREGAELAPIVSLKNKLVTEGIEFGLFDHGVGKLIAISDAEAWAERDYEKPAGDKYSGMLPPKLARIMINLALGTTGTSDKEQGTEASGATRCSSLVASPLMIDPFCGSGNVAMEALMLGLDVFASDISEKAVKDSEENLDWLNTKFLISNSKTNPKFPMPKYEVKQIDATSKELIDLLQQRVGDYDCLAIVGEPYLGEPKKFKPSMNAACGEYKKVKELYLNFLKSLIAVYPSSEGRSSRLPASNSKDIVICLVFPLVETSEGKRYSLYRDCVDEIKKIGYTPLQSPLQYGRDYQVVKREIALLTYRKG